MRGEDVCLYCYRDGRSLNEGLTTKAVNREREGILDG